MTKLKRTPLQSHVKRWKNCKLCGLCERRGTVVLGKGSIPCDVLFIGEAPGASEDTLGRPFEGPAGRLLDRIIREAMGGPDRTMKIAFTNLIACMPKGEEYSKIEPPKEAIMACKGRLIEFVRLCRPDLIVHVGKHSQEWCPKLLKEYLFFERDGEFKHLDMVHPAHILRADVTQRGLLVQRSIADLYEAVESLIPF